MYDDSPPPNVTVDIELLIEEIRKRPVLWDRFSVEYNDRVTKMKLWEEVHEAVFDDWTQLGSADKRIRSKYLAWVVGRCSTYSTIFYVVCIGTLVLQVM